jgi:hypothetical protein
MLGNARGGDAPTGGGETVRLRRGVDRGPGGAAADPHDPSLGVHVDVGEAAHVEHQTALAQRESGDRVTAGPHRDCQPMRASEGERGDHVVGRAAACDDARPRGDHRVEQAAGVLVLGIARLVQAAAEAEAKLVEGALNRRRHAARSYGRSVRAASPFPAIPAPWPEPATTLTRLAATNRNASHSRSLSYA